MAYAFSEAGLKSHLRQGFFSRRNLTCGSCCVKGLTQIVKNVSDVLDPDAQSNHLRQHAGASLLLGRHLPMGGRGGMAGQRLRVA